ncbi:MAG: SCO family protein [Gammaproteobacteria bacterium]|nr:MAG: SCO family protein [Gammaproteobacteria bacterium]
MKRIMQIGLAFLACLVLTVQAAPLTFSLNRLENDKAVKVTQDSWNNKYLLIAIGYTTCPDICPTTLLDMREALADMDKTAPEKVKKLQPLFITIDPVGDSLKNITQYTAYFDPRIIGLRTDDFAVLDNVVAQLHGSYGYQFEGKVVMPPDLPKGYTVMHSTFIYLYSPDGQLVDTYPYNMDGKTLAGRIVKNLP